MLRLLTGCALALSLAASGPLLAQSGTAGGSGAETSPAAVPGAQARGPVRISGGVAAGLAQNKVAPVYPAEAREAGVSGSVVMVALIGRDGAVQSLQVVSGPEMLRGAAIDAVQQWRYRPYLLNGEPVEIETTITVNFNLEPKSSAGNR